jgi:predicted nucleotidyltransferase
MKRAKVIQTLRQHQEELAKRFGVKSLALFGSMARDEATETSDVDLLVEFERTDAIGLFALFELQDHLEELLGYSVDLGTPNSLKSRIRDHVLSESINVN